MRNETGLPYPEPYRLLLPLGIAAGLSGVSLWIFHIFQAHEEAVGLPHAQVMTGSFLFCFVAGYLMSLLPRLTSTPAARPAETLLAAVLALGSGLCALAGAEKVSYAFAFFGLGWLLWFVRVRAHQSPRHLPASFVFILLGLFLGWLGTFVLAVPVAAVPGDPTLAFARRLYFQAMLVFLMLGEGSRIFPLLCGRIKHTHPRILETASVSSVLLAGYGFEALDFLVLGGFLKAAAPTWVAARYWGLFSPLTVGSKLAMGLLISAPLFLAGLWMAWFLPGAAAEWMHLSYIGGFTLMSLMIMTRLILVEGRYDLSLEVSAPGTTLVIGLICMATLFRAMGPLFSTKAAGFLAAASIFWIAGITAWSIRCLAKLIDPSTVVAESPAEEDSVPDSFDLKP